MERQEGHTPEPWRYEPERLGPGGYHIGGRSPTIFAGERVLAKVLRVTLDSRIKSQRDKAAEANAARIAACVNTLDGIPTSALEQLASLPPKERFGALSDIAKLHEMKEE